ncbi:hypothetical protein NQ315_010472 [Exocentrus adspersus]|uniref:Cathepsin L n=1 Tax=Exocentrus adspersus TaxID=1586481 RepID=A0AAV8W5G0_9CUCU|nr:hypothetical protein NQ315_010472 [Exocentrus adspersus]
MMRFVIVFVSIVLAVNAASVKELWTEFKQQHGRDYRNLREEQHRFSVFQNNLRVIQEQNQKYDNGESTYFFGINQFADMTPAEFKFMLNYSASVKPPTRSAAVHKMSGLQAPESVNWVQKGAVTPVKSQEQCGSCWSFSAVGSLEGAYAVATGQLVSFSEQNLIDCDTVDAGCDGGVMQYAFDFVQQNGIERQDDYPYQGVRGQCQMRTDKVATRLSTYINIPQNENALLDAVANHGPVAVAVDADGYQYYAGGLYDDPSCKQEYNHGVVVVGYGTENGNAYWLVKNSWGTGWGDGGYIKMARDKNNQCSISTDASYPVVKIIMRVLVILASVVLAINAATDRELWTEFKQNFGREYRNLREEQLRFSVFQNNLRNIEEHNEKYDSGEESYYLAVTPFTDLTTEEFQNMLNFSAAAKPVLEPIAYHTVSLGSTPSSINWVSKKLVTGVKNQGQCGSCWSFSATGAVEGAHAKKTGELVSLSEQNLMDCDTADAACNGGDMTNAFNYIAKHGIESEANYPYKAKQSACKFSSSKVAAKISGYKRVAASETALRDAVGNIGPIAVGISADKIQNYGGGVFDNKACNGEINHGVLVVGYGNADGKDYWLVKNSWGTGWGEKGYFRLVRNKSNQCHIASEGSYPIAA